MTKIVAVMGSYRRDGIIEQTVDAILRAAGEAGAETEKIVLADETIEFCTNCRKCTGPELPGMRRADCIFDDRMHEICESLDKADGIVLAAPINFFTVNALTKRFIERLLVYVYWPWEKPLPKPRIKKLDKKAVVVTASACPACLGRWLMPNALSVMKGAARLVGAKVSRTLYFGMVCKEEHQRLSPGQARKAQKAGRLLAAN
ncbi:MAG: flavodoxin family protein [Planctomycetaceae bacterium]|jgi:NAD(P)H-dependent FMN reductase|nr:flavodoxin family protein [Planctomycetaceae bacterium]